MTDCIFCKIVKGEIPAVKIWEDEKFIAILDKFPNTKGQAIVISKRHFDSNAANMPDEDYKELMIAAKRVAKLLERKLKAERTAMVAEGLGVNHVHVKLYPVYEAREGYITTQLGPQKSIEELNKIAERIKN